MSRFRIQTGAKTKKKSFLSVLKPGLKMARYILKHSFQDPLIDLVVKNKIKGKEERKRRNNKNKEKVSTLFQ